MSNKDRTKSSYLRDAMRHLGEEEKKRRMGKVLAKMEARDLAEAQAIERAKARLEQ